MRGLAGIGRIEPRASAVQLLRGLLDDLQAGGIEPRARASRWRSVGC